MKYDLKSLKKAYEVVKKSQIINISMDIQKFDDEERMVWGYASTEKLDCQGEIVSADAMKSAWNEYMKFGNIREMHTNSAVGVVKEYDFKDDGVFIGVKVVDDTAWAKVKEGVYKGFSIGGAIVEKVGKVIKSLILSEISLVDRPANPGAVITVFKMADFENIEEENELDEKIVKSLEELNNSGYSLEEILEIVKKSKEQKDQSDKVVKDALLAKGFYEIKDIISVIDILSWVLDDKEWQAKWSNDDNTEILTSLRDHIISITELAQQMLQNEIKDLNGVSDSVVELNTKIEDIIKNKPETNKQEEIVNKLNKANSDLELLTKSSNDKDVLITEKDAKIAELEAKIEVLNKNAIFEKKSDIKTVKKEIVKENKTDLTIDEVKKGVDDEINSINEKLSKSDCSNRTNLTERLTVLKMKRMQLNIIK